MQAEREAQLKAEEEAFKANMMARFAEQDRVEQMNAQVGFECGDLIYYVYKLLWLANCRVDADREEQMKLRLCFTGHPLLSCVVWSRRATGVGAS